MSYHIQSTSKYTTYPDSTPIEIRLIYAISNLGLTANNVWEFFEYPSKSTIRDAIILQKDFIDALPFAQKDDYIFYAQYLVRAFQVTRDTNSLFLDRHTIYWDKLEMLAGLVSIFDDPEWTPYQKEIIINSAADLDRGSDFLIQKANPEIKDKIKNALLRCTYKEWDLPNITRYLTSSTEHETRAWLQDHLAGVANDNLVEDRTKMMQLLLNPLQLQKYRDLLFTKDGLLQDRFLQLLHQYVKSDDVRLIEQERNKMQSETTGIDTNEIDTVIFALSFNRNIRDQMKGNILDHVEKYSKYKDTEFFNCLFALQNHIPEESSDAVVHKICSILQNIKSMNRYNHYAARLIEPLLLHESREIRLTTVQTLIKFRTYIPATLLRSYKNVNGTVQFGTGLNIANTQSFKRFIGCYAPEWKKLVMTHEKIHGSLDGVESLLLGQSIHAHDIAPLELDMDNESIAP